MPHADGDDLPVVAILLACRLPERGSSHLPPALEILDGVPLVLMAARELHAAGSLAGADVLVLAPIGFAPHVRSALAELSDRVRVIEGADTADGSLHVALGELAAAPDALVVIHDACRPLTPATQIDRVLAACAHRGGGPVIPVLPITESVKTLDDGGRIVASIVRESVVRVQTPQADRLSGLRRTHAACQPGRGPDATYFVSTGHDTELVAGDELSMPVLSAGDRELAIVLRRRSLRREEPAVG